VSRSNPGRPSGPGIPTVPVGTAVRHDGQPATVVLVRRRKYPRRYRLSTGALLRRDQFEVS
jgi:hypothetical protein